MDVGDAIKLARTKAKLTQAQLAEKSGLAAITIHQYEAGKRQPRLEQLGKIASALDITVYDLIGWDWSSLDMDSTGQGSGTSAEMFDSSLTKARLDAAYSRLNLDGQVKARERVEELTEIPKYRRTPQ